MLKEDNIGGLFYTSADEAKAFKNRTLDRWKQIKLRKEVCIERDGHVRWKSLLEEFRGGIRGLVSKCDATIGVFSKRKGRVQEAEARTTITGITNFEKLLEGSEKDSKEVDELTREIRELEIIVREVGNICIAIDEEIDATMQAIYEERRSSRPTLPGQTRE